MESLFYSHHIVQSTFYFIIKEKKLVKVKFN